MRRVVSLHLERAGWSFARQLPPSLTRLRLTCRGDHIVDGLERLKHCPNLQELDVDLAIGPDFKKPEFLGPRYQNCLGYDAVLEKFVEYDSASFARALAGLQLKRVGLHSSSGCHSLYAPDFQAAELHRTFYYAKEAHLYTLEDQIDEGSRPRVTKLTLHVHRVSSCPSLSACSVLKELVIGDIWRDFDSVSEVPLTVSGLEVVAGTLRHLTVSSSRRDICIELPNALCLRSFACVCSGTLHLHCNADTLGKGLRDVLLGYTGIVGTGLKLVEELAPRLGAAVVEVDGSKRLRQSLLFTRAPLVGKWWNGVFQVSKQQSSAGCFCCRVRVWAQGRICPSHLTFMRYGIVAAHEDRDVLCGPMDELLEYASRHVYPGWHERF